MARKSILLAGATGLVGGECLKLLLKDDEFDRVVILTRTPLSGLEQHAKIQQHRVDFENLAAFGELMNVNQVICTLGTTIKKAGSQAKFREVDFTYPVTLAKLALERGAEHFLVVSSMGADPNSKIFYNRVKGEMESEVLTLGYRSVSIFRPSLLLGDRKEVRLGEQAGKIVGKLISFALPAKYRPVQAHTVAEAILKTARADSLGTRIIESDEIQQLGRMRD